MRIILVVMAVMLFAGSVIAQGVADKSRRDSAFVRVDSASGEVVHAFKKIICAAIPDSLIGLSWATGDTIRLYGVKGNYGKGKAIVRWAKMPELSDSAAMSGAIVEYNLVGKTLTKISK